MRVIRAPDSSASVCAVVCTFAAGHKAAGAATRMSMPNRAPVTSRELAVLLRASLR